MRHSPAEIIRVLVVDSTRVYTELIADALKRFEFLQVTTLPASSDRLTTDIDLGDIDVLLISSDLEGKAGRGLELFRGLRALNADLKSVVLLESSQGAAILEAFQAGARGIFSKSDSAEVLGKCIRKVYEGEIWANNQQMGAVIEAIASSPNIRAVNAQGMNLLSKREMEVVSCVAQGFSNREIAERFHLSQHTIKNCLFRVFDKLGVSSRVELLFMTLSREKNVQCALQCFLDGRSLESLRDQGVNAACAKAASRGNLIAQIALAQFYATRKADPEGAFQAYVWYSRANEQISKRLRGLVKELTIERIAQAESVAAQISTESMEHRTAIEDGIWPPQKTSTEMVKNQVQSAVS